jgi:hypothetical protein
VFLRVMCGWPASLLDWDVLFLLPLPWWGPVLAPVSIAVLMIVWGTSVTQFARRGPTTSLTRLSWAAGASGIGLALYVFMADALRVAHLGADAVSKVLPAAFNWPLFCVAVTLMAAPVVQSAWQMRLQRQELRPERCTT